MRIRIFLFMTFMLVSVADGKPTAEISELAETVPNPDNTVIFAELPPNTKPRKFLNDSLNALEQAFKKEHAEVFVYERHELLRAVDLYSPQLVIADSDLAAVLERYKHYEPMLSFKSSVTDDAASMGATLVVVRNDSPVNRLEQLNGERIGRLSQANMAGWKSALGEVSLLGFNPSDFFRRTEFFRSPQLLAQALIEGKVQAALFPGCIFESLSDEIRSKLKGVEPRVRSGLHCLSTTMLYPAWTILSSPNFNEGEKQKTVKILLNLKTSDTGAEWRLPVSLRDVYAMMRRTHDELIERMEKRTLADQVWEYRYFFWGTILGALFLLLNNLYLKRAVATKEKKIIQMTNRRLAAEEKLVKWEKASMASILSSIVSHELKQPLSIIENYIVGITKKSEKINNPSDRESIQYACKKISAQTARAIRLIDYVRSYSRNPASKKETVVLGDVLENQVQNLRSSLSKAIRLKLSVPKNYKAFMDPFELEICVHNLVKNAKEAIGEGKEGSITVSIKPHDPQGFILTVEDSGPLVTKEILEKIKTPGKSTKSEGLGLGLAIVRGIADKYHGSLDVIPCTEKGRGTIIAVSFLTV